MGLKVYAMLLLIIPRLLILPPAVGSPTGTWLLLMTVSKMNAMIASIMFGVLQ